MGLHTQIVRLLDNSGPPGLDGADGTAGGGGATATTVEKDLGSTPVSCGRFTITDAAISSSSKVLVWQAPGPYTGKGTRADEAELSRVDIVYVKPAAGSCEVSWETPPTYFSIGQGLLGGEGGAPTNADLGTGRGRIWRHDRVGKVKGNVKFSYVVFA